MSDTTPSNDRLAPKDPSEAGADAVADDSGDANGASVGSGESADSSASPVEQAYAHADEPGGDALIGPEPTPEHDASTHAQAEPEQPITKPRADEARSYPTQVSGTDAAGEAQAPTVPVSPVSQGSPVYVQAPSAPKPKGNRGFGILVGLLASIAFAAVYLGGILLVNLIKGNGGAIDIVGLISSAAFFVPVAMFFLGFVVISALINRGGWWLYILGGLLVGLFAYVGVIGGALIHNAMEIPSNRVVEFIGANLLSWPAVIAFVVGREVPVWFGAWIAARGRKVKERNSEAKAEYERELEAGPVV